MSEMNPAAKKNKKIKEVLKAVKKINDDQMDQMTDLLNKVIIMRHKLKMIWF